MRGENFIYRQYLSLIFGGIYVYECFHCLHRAVIWDADFSFEDYCLEGEGLIHVLHCSNCGAEIEYSISFEDEEYEIEYDPDNENVDKGR